MSTLALVLAPHTDDGEFGCGGTIVHMLSQGHEVIYVAFSVTDALLSEVKRATSLLGIKSNNLRIYDFPMRDFASHRQSILEKMVSLQKELQPDIVFLPSQTDTHQDHQTISAEGFRAFKKTTMLGYELPWNNLTFTTNVFVALSEEEIAKKIASVAQYVSQSDRSYASSDFIRSLARVRGTQIGITYAEAFGAIRWVMA